MTGGPGASTLKRCYVPPSPARLRVMRRVPLFIILGIAWSAPHAQRGRSYHTIESRVAAAESVHLGKVVKFEMIDPGSPASASQLTKHATYRFQVSVEETLKGAPAKRLALTSGVPFVGDASVLIRERTPILFFIVAGDPVKQEIAYPRWQVQTLAPSTCHLNAVQVKDGIKLFSMDFAVLKTKDEILRLARGFARKYPQGIQETVLVHVDQDVAARGGPPADANGVLVPVVPELEQLARNLIIDPYGALRSAPRPNELANLHAAWYRKQGLELIRPFKSERNIAIVKKYLDDPAVRGEYRADGTSRPEYWVRDAALQTLKEWSVNAPCAGCSGIPIHREGLPRRASGAAESVVAVARRPTVGSARRLGVGRRDAGTPPMLIQRP